MNVTPVNQSINFQATVKTMDLLSLTTMKAFCDDGFEGMIRTLKTLYPVPRYVGNQGYRHYIKILTEQIESKYSEIADSTRVAKQIITENPSADKKTLQDKLRPIINKIGEEIDIVV